ncbi:CBO0543 family protein [Paenibacillus cremeus]|uniref:Uncharacterized protein n=1 Tax=Paenibacillus cremeus TaxID=2163881 RepID=A0A559KI25_9BACL|nr:CBO0543 family protein [Paenibacillus cremeus]TVY11784.1 hypothetical protein FPZ49_00360 [Paenibacillus cremeus]
MRFIINLVFIIAAWKWGDWRHWKAYYPTILFLITGDLLYNFLTYNFTLWQFRPVAFDQPIYSNHTLITLGIDFINFPATVLLFLGNYPKTRVKQAFYFLAWVSFSSAMEYFIHRASGLTYAHGWNFWYSATFNVILFSLLRIHHLRPLLACGISAVVVVFYSWFFHLPVSSMK